MKWAIERLFITHVKPARELEVHPERADLHEVTDSLIPAELDVHIYLVNFDT